VFNKLLSKNRKGKQHFLEEWGMSVWTGFNRFVTFSGGVLWTR